MRLLLGFLVVFSCQATTTPRLHFPPLTKHDAWASQSLSGWLPFLHRPADSQLGPFVEWIFRLARVQDVPSLYSIMAKSWLTLAPLGSKGAARQPLPALVFLVSHLALTVGRCRAVLKQKRWPPWFQQLWKTFPSEHRSGIASADFGWFTQLVQWAQGQGGHSAVYSLYSHSGLYIGKANLLRRAGTRRGLAERLIEHMTGLLFPSSRDGNLPRYKVLRSSVGSIGFFPLRVFDTELRTLAAERALIVELKPSANGADWAALPSIRKHGRLLQPMKVGRKRPPPAVRKPKDLGVPIWDQLHFTRQHKKQSDTVSPETSAIPKLSFNKLYRYLQQRCLVTLGLVGPLALFGAGAYPLFAAFLATKRPRIWFPQSWCSWQVAQQLYGAARLFDSRIPGFGARLAARKTCEYLLKRYRLPPLCVKPWVVPRGLVRRLGALRCHAFKSLSGIRNAYSRYWLMDHIRVVPGRTERWSHRSNAKSQCNSQSLDLLQGLSPSQLQCLCNLPSLRAMNGAWRLPVWPTWHRVQSQLKRSWTIWAEAHRLPPRTAQAGRSGVYSFLAHLHLPEAPAQWSLLESAMQRQLKGSTCVVLDDKLPSKLWACEPLELFAFMLANVRADPMWKVHVHINKQSLHAINHAKAILGLPLFLRSGATSKRHGLPVLFGFIKSKCFNDAGVKTCKKANHSCIRRVLDTSQCPHAFGWKVIGRAVRGTMQSIEGHEVFDQSQAIPAVIKCLGALQSGSGVCKRCHCVLPHGLSVYSADIDQAFEACDNNSVGKAWAWASSAFISSYNSSFIQVRRGRQFAVRPGTEGWSRGWWVISMTQIQAALVASAASTFCALGDVVVQLRGVSIGGSLSSSAVAVHLAFEESTAFDSERLAAIGFQNCGIADVQWCRYVDDILSFSRTLCSRCVSVFFSTLYSEKLSEVYSSDLALGNPCNWLLFEFHIRGPHLAWTLKNNNRSYLYGVPGQIFVPSLVAWPGCLPMPFKQLRGILVNKLYISWSALLSPPATAIVLLELLLEMLRLGYPMSLLRSLIHSVPKWPAVILARQVFRAFHRTSLDIRGSTMPKGGGNYGNPRYGGTGVYGRG